MDETRQSGNGWDEWRKLVLHEQMVHSERLNCIDKKLTIIHTDIAILKTKAAFYGALAGLLATVIIEATFRFAK